MFLFDGLRLHIKIIILYYWCNISQSVILLAVIHYWALHSGSDI